MECGGRVELLLPVREMRIKHWSLKRLTLPDGEVSVLDGEVIEGRRQGVREAVVEGREFGDEETQRPGIGDDVMDAEEEEGGAVREGDKGGSKEWAASEVEGESGL